MCSNTHRQPVVWTVAGIMIFHDLGSENPEKCMCPIFAYVGSCFLYVAVFRLRSRMSLNTGNVEASGKE